MIGTFKNKALRNFWFKDQDKGINPDHIRRVAAILDILEEAEDLEDMDVTGYRFHALKGHKPTRYSMRVSQNWRITFEWDEPEANRIDYEDYH